MKIGKITLDDEINRSIGGELCTDIISSEWCHDYFLGRKLLCEFGSFRPTINAVSKDKEEGKCYYYYPKKDCIYSLYLN